MQRDKPCLISPDSLIFIFLFTSHLTSGFHITNASHVHLVKQTLIKMVYKDLLYWGCTTGHFEYFAQWRHFEYFISYWVFLTANRIQNYKINNFKWHEIISGCTEVLPTVYVLTHGSEAFTLRYIRCGIYYYHPISLRSIVYDTYTINYFHDVSHTKSLPQNTGGPKSEHINYNTCYMTRYMIPYVLHCVHSLTPYITLCTLIIWQLIHCVHSLYDTLYYIVYTHTIPYILHCVQFPAIDIYLHIYKISLQVHFT